MHTGARRTKGSKDKMSVWVVCVCVCVCVCACVCVCVCVCVSERREFCVAVTGKRTPSVCKCHKNEVETAYKRHVSNVITA